MKTLLRKIIFLLICMSPFLLSAQKAQQDMDKDKAPANHRAQRKKAKQKWKEDRIIEKGQRDAVIAHDKKIQTKKTLKRMRQEKRKSEKLRANKRDPAIIRWFKRKRH
jgi:Ni/Co efflux regulator RcnB